MIIFPKCKINLGLSVVGVRADGYHDIETVFYPIPLRDALEINEMSKRYPEEVGLCDIAVSGTPEAMNGLREFPVDDNLIVKAYKMIAKDFDIPRLHLHLFKRIPSQAGLGGGSSDAAYMIRMLDSKYQLDLGNVRMEEYASRIGADCAFFITGQPSFATGKGDVLMPIGSRKDCKHYLEGYWILLVKPDIAVSTVKAYAQITPKKPAKSCRDIVMQPVDTWKDELINDFEEPVFKEFPRLGEIKEQIYSLGATYAAMSGSGSTIYGIFREEPQLPDGLFQDCFTHICQL